MKAGLPAWQPSVRVRTTRARLPAGFAHNDDRSAILAHMHRWLIQGAATAAKMGTPGAVRATGGGSAFRRVRARQVRSPRGRKRRLRALRNPVSRHRDVPRRRSGADRWGGPAARLVRAPLRLSAGLQHDRSDHHGRTHRRRPGAPAAGASAAGGHPVSAVGGCRGRVPRWAACLPANRCSLTADLVAMPRPLGVLARRTGRRSSDRPAGGDLRDDAVPAAGERGGGGHVPRRPVPDRPRCPPTGCGSAPEHTRSPAPAAPAPGTRPSIDPAACAPPYGRNRHVRVTTGNDCATTPVAACVR